MNHPKLESVIEPIFMSNSGLHFGEMCRSPEITPNLRVYNIGGQIIIPNRRGINGTAMGGGGVVLLPI